MNTGLIFTLITSFAILYIGIITTYHDKKSITNRLFAFISLVTVAWSLVNYFSLQPIILSELVWVRLVIFFAIPHVIFFYFFTKNFPEQNLNIKRSELYTISGVGILLMIASLTPLIFSNLRHIGERAIPIPGTLIPLLGIFIVSMLIASMVQIIKKYRHADNKEKIGWRSMLIGFIVSYVSLIFTNFVLVNTTGDTRFVLYAPLLMLPSILGTSYSIIKYQLLNVKAIATEIIVFILLSVTLVQAILSQTTSQFVFNIILFCVFLLIGIFLIKSVLVEVEQKEKLQILSDELARANEKLKDLDKLKTEFLSLASHQLRSPLTAIKGYTSMLLDGSFGKVNDNQKEAVDRVFQSSQHLTKVVEDLLNVTKIEQGGMKYEMTPFDFSQTVEDIAKDLSITANKKGLTLEYSDDKQKPYMVYGDMEKIRQVVLNLIDNSIKYTQQGSIKVWIERNTPKTVLCGITDTGMGITPETIATLFQKFNRGEGGKVNTGGSGLGLYLAKQIVEAHKGRVWVESPGIGRGSTFYIELSLNLS